jgi:hypothetical protein
LIISETEAFIGRIWTGGLRRHARRLPFAQHHSCAVLHGAASPAGGEDRPDVLEGDLVED